MSKHSPLIGRPPFLVRKGIAGPVTYNEWLALPGSWTDIVMTPANRRFPPGLASPRPYIFGPGARYNTKVTLQQLGELLGAVRTLKLTSLTIPPTMPGVWDHEMGGARTGTVQLKPGEVDTEDLVGGTDTTVENYENYGIMWFREHAINQATTAWGDHRDSILGARISSTRSSSFYYCDYNPEIDDCNFYIDGVFPGDSAVAFFPPGTPFLLVPQVQEPAPNPNDPPVTWGPFVAAVRVTIDVNLQSLALHDLTGSGSIFDPGNELWVNVRITATNENTEFGGADFLHTDWSSEFGWFYPTGQDGSTVPAPNGIVTINLPSGPLEIPALYWLGEGSGGTCVIDAIPW